MFSFTEVELSLKRVQPLKNSKTALCPSRKVLKTPLKVAIMLPPSFHHSWDVFCESTCLQTHIHLYWQTLCHRSKEVVRCLHTDVDLQYTEVVMLHLCYLSRVLLQILACGYFLQFWGTRWSKRLYAPWHWCWEWVNQQGFGGEKEVKGKQPDTSSPLGITPKSTKRGRL